MEDNVKRAPLGDDLVEDLIQAYRPLVLATARRLRPLDPQNEDLLQCGLIGLWRAAERWDQTRPFGPLARHCIHSEMVDYLRREDRRFPAVSLDSLRDNFPWEEDWGKVLLQEVAETWPRGSRKRALLLALCGGATLTQAAKGVGLRRERARRMLERACRRSEIL